MSSPVAAQVHKQEPKMYGFLGDDFIAAFVRRVIIACGLGKESTVEYNQALFANARLRVDQVVLENLSQNGVDTLVVMRNHGETQAAIHAFLLKEIPDLNEKVDHLLTTILTEQKEAFTNSAR